MAGLLLPSGVGALAQAPQGQSSPPIRYKLKDLGTLGGASSMSYYVSNNEISSGNAALPNGTSHAVLWYGQKIRDIATPGLGGQNSASLNSTAFSNNERGQASGGTEISRKDPNAEDFCGYGTDHRCIPFFWLPGRMFTLQLLGGNNGQAISINRRAQVTGVSETSRVDYTCAAAKPSQVLDYEPVLWSPLLGRTRKLPLLGSDSVGVGLWLNDNGQIIGQSGSCGNTTLPPLVVGPHAILWDKDGSIRDLGNLGGACEKALCIDKLLGPFGNTPLYITNMGEIVGASALSDSGPFHAFLWTKERGRMKDLGTLDGDVASVALGMSENGKIVGLSFDKTGMPHAFLRVDGKMLDLETLIPDDSPLVPLGAEIINAKNEIAGFGVDPNTGGVHGYLAIPCDLRDWDGKEKAKRFAPSDSMRREIREHLAHRHPGL
jgi:probable HAF family extracellular repeat protein